MTMNLLVASECAFIVFNILSVFVLGPSQLPCKFSVKVAIEFV